VEHLLPRALRPAAAADPLSLDGPSPASRGAARAALYVHVPFCAVRCTYCHFSTAPLEAGQADRWLAALEREIDRRAAVADGTAFTSIFLGGGTPSVLTPRQVTRVFELLGSRFSIAPGAEITLEANPESVTAPRLEAWRAAGVNRLSFGAQSFEPSELKLLGRVHSAERPAAAIERAREHGFERLSIDLMFGWPGHTPDAFARSVARALSLGVEHLSAYAFIPDRGNPLGDAVLDGRAEVADDDAQAEMYECFLALSADAGLHPYETSNVSRPGAEARHNLTYWLRRDHLGLGPSAHGLWRGERRANRHGAREWASALEAGEESSESCEFPGDAAVADEIVMLALRLATGLRLADYGARERELLDSRYAAALAAGVAQGRLERTAEGWRIPPPMRFLADDTIAWLAARAPD
jgi:oxygen-independent coproporphyrinogen-3 oxidase